MESYQSELDDTLRALSGLRRENMTLKCSLNQSEHKAAAAIAKLDKDATVCHR